MSSVGSSWEADTGVIAKKIRRGGVEQAARGLRAAAHEAFTKYSRQVIIPTGATPSNRYRCSHLRTIGLRHPHEQDGAILLFTTAANIAANRKRIVGRWAVEALVSPGFTKLETQAMEAIGPTEFRHSVEKHVGLVSHENGYVEWLSHLHGQHDDFYQNMDTRNQIKRLDSGIRAHQLLSQPVASYLAAMLVEYHGNRL